MLYAYHYTNPDAVRSMRTGESYGRTGLLPTKRFLRGRWGRRDPKQLTDGMVEALPEPLPRAWTHPERHRDVAFYLFHDLTRCDETVLLRFPILPEDSAVVFDRGIIEDVLYTPEDPNVRAPDPVRMRKASLRAYRTRVPAHEYTGGFTLPQFAIFNTIPFERLELVWRRPSIEVWNELCDVTQQPAFRRVPRPEVDVKQLLCDLELA